MYTNEAVQKLTDSLTRRADRASEVAEELDRLDSPSLPAAEAKSREAQDVLAVVQAWAIRELQVEPDPTPAPTELADLRNDVEELREKLHIVRGTAEIAQATTNDAIAQLKVFTSISTDSLKAGGETIAADTLILKNDILKKKIADLKAENQRLRELLGTIDGHAGEIVSALAGEAAK